MQVCWKSYSNLPIFVALFTFLKGEFDIFLIEIVMQNLHSASASFLAAWAFKSNFKQTAHILATDFLICDWAFFIFAFQQNFNQKSLQHWTKAMQPTQKLQVHWLASVFAYFALHWERVHFGQWNSPTFQLQKRKFCPMHKKGSFQLCWFWGMLKSKIVCMCAFSFSEMAFCNIVISKNMGKMVANAITQCHKCFGVFCIRNFLCNELNCIHHSKWISFNTQLTFLFFVFNTEHSLSFSSSPSNLNFWACKVVSRSL